MYTLNFDGSHNNQANKSGAGCVIRDSRGELVVAAAYNLTQTYSEYCNIAIVEAVALLNGLKLAKERNLNLNLIKGDSTEVIDHVLDRSRRPSRPPLSGIIQQIIGMIDGQNIVITDREANQVADKLASWGCNRLQEWDRKIYTTYADLPPQVAELIRHEKSSFSSIREEDDRDDGNRLAGNVINLGAALVGAVAWRLCIDEENKGGSPTAAAVSLLLCFAILWYMYKLVSSLLWYMYKLVSSLLWYMYKLVSGESSSESYDHCTLHYSGSDRHQLRNGGAGCIIRNEQGNLVIAAAYNLDHTKEYNVAIAEAIAWRNGLKLAKTKNVKLDRINGDNEEIILRVLGLEPRAPGFSSLNEIIDEIQKTLRELSINPRSQVQRIGKKDNKTTNVLAFSGSELGLHKEKSYVKEEDLPSKVTQSFHQDKRIWNNGVMDGVDYTWY